MDTRRSGTALFLTLLLACTTEVHLGGLNADGSGMEGGSPDGSGMDGGSPDGSGMDGGSPDGSGMDGGSPDGGMCTSRACESDAGAPCNVVEQCGCDCELACQRVWSTGVIVCATPGLKALGALCADHAECAAGLGCLALLGVPGICTPYCGSGAHCASGDCLFNITGQGLCVQPCDILLGSGCPGSLECTAVAFVGEPGGGVDRVSSFCVTPGMIGPRGRCSDDYSDRANNCEPGSFCIGPSGAGRCAPICEVRAPNCSAGTSCTTATTFTIAVSGAVYGVCL